MRVVRFTFAILSYACFLAVFLYLIGFVGNLLVPRSIDVAPPSPLGRAVIIDLALVALFGLQHSIMARPSFKRAMSGVIHPSVERAVYVLASVVVLVVLFAFWQPIPRVVWSVAPGWPTGLLWALFAAGWLVVFVTTWLINHFELFGLQQVWLDLKGRESPPPRFREPLFYRHVRHPLYLGFLLAFWSAPTMTAGHALFAAAMTIYILIAIRYEERDLTAQLGDSYAEYRKRVGMLIPGLGRDR